MRGVASVAVALAIACGGKGKGASSVHDADNVELTDCAFLGKVDGTTSGTGMEAAERAKNNAREKAAALGATVIKWIVPCCTDVEGDAYRCDVPDK
jgi:hypothetical protein